ncbi:hypothetical protein [Geobacillus sp. C56-T2]|uniref:hypothetical protein n=1 Tax=Geobacillus sp. C56-T2 TaxID=600773 RepID=UPI0011A5ACC1|nr:hypothetical protein [Geobacillus sp. C56-T2]NNV05394.1 hypothetical protein [Geobacillus sp. MMMUD3]TWG31208.1 hypothetical protein GC56T2_2419 [Geobacillus sp. C56-T2]
MHKWSYSLLAVAAGWLAYRYRYRMVNWALGIPPLRKQVVRWALQIPTVRRAVVSQMLRP